MKNIIIIMMLVIGSVTVAFAAKPIPSYNYAGEYAAQAAAPTTASNAEEVHAALARIEGKLNKKGRSGGSEARIKQSMLQHAKYADNKAAEHALGLHNHMSESFWMTLVVILVAAIIIIGVGTFFYRRTRREARRFIPGLIHNACDTLQVATDNYRATEIVRNTSAEALELMRVVNTKLDNLETKVEEVPDKTAEKTAVLIKTLDPTPFVFIVVGHEVTYTPSPERIAEGNYDVLYIPEKPHTYDPIKFRRVVKQSRGKALDSLKESMTEYLEGTLDASVKREKLQIDLIDHLKANPAGNPVIKIRKL